MPNAGVDGMCDETDKESGGTIREPTRQELRMYKLKRDEGLKNTEIALEFGVCAQTVTRSIGRVKKYMEVMEAQGEVPKDLAVRQPNAGGAVLAPGELSFIPKNSAENMFSQMVEATQSAKFGAMAGVTMVSSVAEIRDGLTDESLTPEEGLAKVTNGASALFGSFFGMYKGAQGLSKRPTGDATRDNGGD